jgi:hypothetical protein
MPWVNEQMFCSLLQSKLGASWDRAIKIFHDYGPNLSYDVTNILCFAADQAKTDEVLEVMEKHYKSHLQFQHPDIRGTAGDRLLGVNPTTSMFLRIYQQTLGLQVSLTEHLLGTEA